MSVRVVTVLVATGLAQASCAADPPAPAGSDTTGRAPAPAAATVTVRGLVLVDPLAPERTFRVVVAGGDGLELSLPARLDVPGGRLRVCPVASLSDPRPPDSSCTLLEAGGRLNAGDGPGLDVGLVPVAGQAGSPISLAVGELAITYRDRGPGMSMRLPPLGPGTEVSATRVPTGTEPFLVQAAWPSTDGGQGRLVLDGGPAATATAEGGSPLEASTRASPATDATLRFANAGTTPLVGVTLAVTWP